MPADPDAFLKEWHRIVAEKDVEGLGRILAEGVTLGAPPYWQKLAGREVVQQLLTIIIRTIEGFEYHREWSAGAELALEFTGRVGDLDLQGIDLITLDDDSRLRNLDVMIRPINAVLELRDRVAPQMAAFLSGGESA